MLFILTLMTQILFTLSFNWTSQLYANPTSGSISFHDPNDNIFWQCGGISADSSLIIGCKALDLSRDTIFESKPNMDLRIETYFPGFYREINPYFSFTQNVGLKLDNRVCLMGLKHALAPRCYCCDFTLAGWYHNFYTCEKVNCDTPNSVEPRFDECIISDNDRLIKIGGGCGNTRSKDILTFDVQTESITSNSYGNLAMGVQSAGCTLLTDGTIVVVGGTTATNTYERQIQVCKPNQECVMFPTDIKLAYGVRNTRCIASQNENEVICFGGRDSLGITDYIYIIDIEAQTIQYDFMPEQLEASSIYVSDTKTCLIGGTTLDNNGWRVTSDEIYCTEEVFSSHAS